MQNISKLVVQKDYTYKELCEILGEEAKNGNSMRSQLREWERHLVWNKPKKGIYRILGIRDIPLPAQDKRKNNGGNATSKYSYLEGKIMDALEEANTITATINRLTELINLLTPEYMRCLLNTREYCKENQFHEELVHEYLLWIRKYVCRNIETSLDRLENQGYISKKKYIVVSAPNSSIKLNYLQYRTFLEHEASTLKSMGKTYDDLYDIKVSNKLTNEMKRFLRDKWNLTANFYYREYTIKKLSLHYQPIHQNREQELATKFVVMIAYKLMVYIHSKERYITNTMTGEPLEIVDINDPITIDELRKEVIEISNKLFVHMDITTWQNFLTIFPSNINRNKKAELFWFEYCLSLPNSKPKKLTLSPSSDKNTTAIELNEDVDEETNPYIHMSTVECRNEAIQVLGKNEVEECEYILPNIDWKKICTDMDYLFHYVDALNAYWDMNSNFIYSKEDHIEEFCLYYARITEAGLEDQLVPFYIFKDRPSKYYIE